MVLTFLLTYMAMHIVYANYSESTYPAIACKVQLSFQQVSSALYLDWFNFLY
jgi:hypothetical protein